MLHGEQGVDLFLRDVENVLANVDDGLLGHLAPKPHVLHHPLASLQDTAVRAKVVVLSRSLLLVDYQSPNLPALRKTLQRIFEKFHRSLLRVSDGLRTFAKV